MSYYFIQSIPFFLVLHQQVLLLSGGLTAVLDIVILFELLFGFFQSFFHDREQQPTIIGIQT